MLAPVLAALDAATNRRDSTFECSAQRLGLSVSASPSLNRPAAAVSPGSAVAEELPLLLRPSAEALAALSGAAAAAQAGGAHRWRVRCTSLSFLLSLSKSLLLILK